MKERTTPVYFPRQRHAVLIAAMALAIGTWQSPVLAGYSGTTWSATPGNEVPTDGSAVTYQGYGRSTGWKANIVEITEQSSLPPEQADWQVVAVPGESATYANYASELYGVNVNLSTPTTGAPSPLNGAVIQGLSRVDLTPRESEDGVATFGLFLQDLTRQNYRGTQQNTSVTFANNLTIHIDNTKEVADAGEGSLTGTFTAGILARATFSATSDSAQASWTFAGSLNVDVKGNSSAHYDDIGVAGEHYNHVSAIDVLSDAIILGGETHLKVENTGAGDAYGVGFFSESLSPAPRLSSEAQVTIEAKSLDGLANAIRLQAIHEGSEVHLLGDNSLIAQATGRGDAHAVEVLSSQTVGEFGWTAITAEATSGTADGIFVRSKQEVSLIFGGLDSPEKQTVIQARSSGGGAVRGVHLLGQNDAGATLERLAPLSLVAVPASFNDVPLVDTSVSLKNAAITVESSGSGEGTLGGANAGILSAILDDGWQTSQGVALSGSSTIVGRLGAGAGVLVETKSSFWNENRGLQNVIRSSGSLTIDLSHEIIPANIVAATNASTQPSLMADNEHVASLVGVLSDLDESSVGASNQLTFETLNIRRAEQGLVVLGKATASNDGGEIVSFFSSVPIDEPDDSAQSFNNTLSVQNFIFSGGSSNAKHAVVYASGARASISIGGQTAEDEGETEPTEFPEELVLASMASSAPEEEIPPAEIPDPTPTEGTPGTISFQGSTSPTAFLADDHALITVNAAVVGDVKGVAEAVNGGTLDLHFTGVANDAKLQLAFNNHLADGEAVEETDDSGNSGDDGGIIYERMALFADVPETSDPVTRGNINVTLDTSWQSPATQLSTIDTLTLNNGGEADLTTFTGDAATLATLTPEVLQNHLLRSIEGSSIDNWTDVDWDLDSTALVVDTLAGTGGNIKLNVNTKEGTGQVLTILKSSSGNHTIEVHNQASAKPNGHPILLVRSLLGASRVDEERDAYAANFTLKNRVEVGELVYQLGKTLAAQQLTSEENGTSDSAASRETSATNADSSSDSSVIKVSASEKNMQNWYLFTTTEPPADDDDDDDDDDNPDNPDTPVVPPVPQEPTFSTTALGFFGLSGVQYQAATDDEGLRERLGGLRQIGLVGAVDAKTKTALWAKSSARNTRVATYNATNYDVQMNRVTAGADKRIGERTLMGGFFGYTWSGSSETTPAKLNAQTFEIGAYATHAWNNAFYIDVVGRLGRSEGKLSAVDTEGRGVTARDLTSTYVALSAEVGKE